MSNDKKVYLFKTGEDRLFGTAIKNSMSKTSNSNSSNNNASQQKVGKVDRKKRTEKFLQSFSKTHSKREVEEFRRLMESVSDEEFERICNQADMLTNMLLGDNHDFNLG